MHESAAPRLSTSEQSYVMGSAIISLTSPTSYPLPTADWLQSSGSLYLPPPAPRRRANSFARWRRSRRLGSICWNPNRLFVASLPLNQQATWAPSTTRHNPAWGLRPLFISMQGNPPSGALCLLNLRLSTDTRANGASFLTPTTTHQHPRHVYLIADKILIHKGRSHFIGQFFKTQQINS